jgi:hypothetical protein
VLEALERTLGREHPSTLNSVGNLAFVLRGKGLFDEAEALHRRALEARERTLGWEHPSTLNPVNNLKIVISDKGRQGGGALPARP